MSRAAPVVPPVDGAFVPAAAPSVSFVEADTEAVLLDGATDRLHLLNHTAALVWQCFDGTSTLIEIATDLADALDVACERVLADVVTVTAGLVAEGVVVDGRGHPSVPAAVAPPPPDDADSGGPRVLPEPPDI